ncbi:MAG TPA: Uma2 family endonuclease [Fodinibius sp.]|nr:Uma2 family endonuclease [Fodinibius sp.]
MATQTKSLTYDDYRSLPDDGNQYQLIGGKLIMAPSPKMIHQIISSNLFYVLKQYVSEKKLGQVLYAPADVVLSMRDVVQPDLMYISKARADIIAENNVVEAPDLVVEILSDATKTTDRTSKKALYEQNGAREYWIVEPREQTIDQLILREGTFELAGTFDSSQTLTSPALEGFTLPIDKVFIDS